MALATQNESELFIEVEDKFVAKLSMSRKETMWLKTVMQNPIGGVSIEEEPLEEAAMRKSFYAYLEKAV